MQALVDPPSKSKTGEPVKSYTVYATVWSYIRTLSGGEKIAAKQVQATLTHEVTIRYSSGVAAVKPADQVVLGGRVFDIKDVRNVDEGNIEIRMICKEAAD